MKKKNLIFILSLFFLASCSTGGSNGSIAKPSVSITPLTILLLQ